MNFFKGFGRQLQWDSVDNHNCLRGRSEDVASRTSSDTIFETHLKDSPSHEKYDFLPQEPVWTPF